MDRRRAGCPLLPSIAHGVCCRRCAGCRAWHCVCCGAGALVVDMNAAECFSPAMLRDYGGDSGSGYSLYLGSYWLVEMYLADHAGLSYSDLEDYQEPRRRQCGLCGLVGKTNEGGFINECKHQVCQQLRKYWGIRDFRHPLPTSRPKSEAEKAVRGPWFRRQLMDRFGEGQIYKIPVDQRLDVVLALTLLRESVEAKREQEPTTGNPLTAIGKPEPRRQKAKADDCIACA